MDDYVIWMLSQTDCDMITATGMDTITWPDYIKTLFVSRHNTLNYRVLWAQEDVTLTSAYDPQIVSEMLRKLGKYGEYAGIVIPMCDLVHVITWPGFVVDTQFQLICIDVHAMVTTLDAAGAELHKYVELYDKMDIQLKNQQIIADRNEMELDSLRKQVAEFDGSSTTSRRSLN